MQDYGDEVQDFFTVDKQLAAELEYDMRRYQEQLAEQQQPVRQAAPGAAGRRAAGGRRPCSHLPSVTPHPPWWPPVSGGTVSEGLPCHPYPAGKSPHPSGGGRCASSQTALTLMGSWLLWWQRSQSPRAPPWGGCSPGSLDSPMGSVRGSAGSPGLTWFRSEFLWASKVLGDVLFSSFL